MFNPDIHHCVIDLSSQPPLFLCELCGAEQELQLPISLHEAARLGEEWMEQHAECADPPETWESHPSMTAEQRNPNLR
jgi:hypothetical protein